MYAVTLFHTVFTSLMKKKQRRERKTPTIFMTKVIVIAIVEVITSLYFSSSLPGQGVITLVRNLLRTKLFSPVSPFLLLNLVCEHRIMERDQKNGIASLKLVVHDHRHCKSLLLTGCLFHPKM